MSADLFKSLFDTKLAEIGPVGMARELGYSNHTLVSRIAKGHVEASEKFQKRVMERYHTVQCPHSEKPQARKECARALSAPPTHNPGAMAHWKTCQRCPHKPQGESK